MVVDRGNVGGSRWQGYTRQTLFTHVDVFDGVNEQLIVNANVLVEGRRGNLSRQRSELGFQPQAVEAQAQLLGSTLGLLRAVRLGHEVGALRWEQEGLVARIRAAADEYADPAQPGLFSEPR